MLYKVYSRLESTGWSAPVPMAVACKRSYVIWHVGAAIL